MPFGPDLSSQSAPLLPVILFCLMVFLPALGAAVILVCPPRWATAIKRTALLFALLDLGLFVWYAIPADESHFMLGSAPMQGVFAWSVAAEKGLFFTLGLDGISLPLALLASLIGVLAIAASWSLTQGVKTFSMLLLLLQTGIVGALMSLDSLLLLVFWGVAIVSATLLIGGWGGPRRRSAAVKFAALGALSGGLILAACAILYCGSDLRVLQRAGIGEATFNPEFMKRTAAADEPVRTFNLLSLANIAHTREMGAQRSAEQMRRLAELSAQGQLDGREPAQVIARMRELEAQSRPPSPFTPAQAAELIQLTRLARPPIDNPLDRPLWGGKSFQWWAFVLLFAGLAIQLAAVPLHAWIAGAHAEAATPVAMLLAGGLMKVAGYGLARIVFPICPAGVDELVWLILGAGLLSMIYGALAALRQRELNRRIAWSSVSFMGYVVFGLGLGSLNAPVAQASLAVQSAMFQLIAHGLVVAGLFFVAGMMRDRTQEDSLDHGGGWLGRMPLAGTLALFVFAAAAGLPVLSWFIGQGRLEFGAWGRVETLALTAAAAALLTAGTMGWTTVRLFFRRRDKASPSPTTPATRGELGVVATVLLLAALLGAFPRAITAFLGPSVSQGVHEFQAWKALKAEGEKIRSDGP